MDRVPILDLACSCTDDDSTTTTKKNNIVSHLDYALREYGFFYVLNHGIDEDLIQEQFDIAKQLFDLPLSTKLSMPFDPLLDIGYLASGGQAVGLTKQQQQPNNDDDVDLEKEEVDGDENNIMNDGSYTKREQKDHHQIDTKEQFMMTNNKLITKNVSTTTSSGGITDKNDDGSFWMEKDSTTHSSSLLRVDPNDVFAGSKNYDLTKYIPDHRRVTSAYMSAAYKLNVRLQEYLFEALGLYDDDDDEKNNNTANNIDGNVDGVDRNVRDRLGAHPFLVLKQMKYDAGKDGVPSDPSVGRYGAGPHTDWGSFTILATDQTPGLQIYRSEYGSWLDVPPVPGALIINAGDQISILTNQVYKSALHRVLISKETLHRPRYSTAIFAYFGMDATFSPLPQFMVNDIDDDNDNGDEIGREKTDPSLGRTTREYFHFKLHQSVFGVTGRDNKSA